MSLLYEEESYKIRGAVFEVYNQLGYGHKEIIYQKALAQTFANKGLVFETEKRLPVFFDGQKVGVYVPDFLIGSRIIIEVKAKPVIVLPDIRQFWQYLKGTDYKLGLLINFGNPRDVQIIRRVYDTKRSKEIPRKSARDSA